MLRTGFGPRQLYILGVLTVDGEPLSTMEAYDPLTKALKQLSSMPTSRFHQGGVALDGKLYVLGGCSDDGFNISRADVYDPLSDRWQPLDNMLTRLATFAAAAAGGKIYTIGGVIDEGMNDEGAVMEAIALVQAFDPLLGAWAVVASMSVGRVHHAAGVVDGKIYAIGGCLDDSDCGVSLDVVEVYDPQANSWQLVASMPDGGRQMHAVAVLGGKIYVSGGSFDDGEFTSKVAVFDPQANAWAEVASMLQARAAHDSAVIGGKLYVFGGYVAHGRTALVEAYDPVSNTWASAGSWDWATAREQFVVVAL